MDHEEKITNALTWPLECTATRLVPSVRVQLIRPKYQLVINQTE
jgi:hypothetical protein